MSSAAAYTGSMFEDDIHDLDYVLLAAGTIAAAIGTSVTDLTVDNVGGTGPSCPNNYCLKIDYAIITNIAGSAINATIQRTNGTLTEEVAIIALAANTTLVLSGERFKFIAYPTWKFQVLSSAATSLIFRGLARLTKGASQ